MAVIDSVRKLVAKEFGVSPELVTPDTLIDGTLGGKSEGLDLYEFYDAVEKSYGLAIGYDELTVKELAERIEEHRKATRWWKRRV